MSQQRKCDSIPSATFLQESGDGQEPLNWQDGTQQSLFGQDQYRANPFRAQAKEKGQKTKGTCGRNFTVSSGSVALQSCLENRLRQRMDVNGSINLH